MSNLEKFEITKVAPCRFIGKSVYARSGQSGYIFGGLWGNSDWVFKKLDSMKEYTIDEHNVALITFDKYDENKKLIGYTVGRFMKADTPVPAELNGTEHEMDYFDIPAMFAAKGFVKSGGEFGDAQRLTGEAISQQEKYIATEDFFAEIYTNPSVNHTSITGYYISCKEKE